LEQSTKRGGVGISPKEIRKSEKEPCVVHQRKHRKGYIKMKGESRCSTLKKPKAFKDPGR